MAVISLSIRDKIKNYKDVFWTSHETQSHSYFIKNLLGDR